MKLEVYDLLSEFTPITAAMAILNLSNPDDCSVKLLEEELTTAMTNPSENYPEFDNSVRFPNGKIPRQAVVDFCASRRDYPKIALNSDREIIASDKEIPSKTKGFLYQVLAVALSVNYGNDCLNDIKNLVEELQSDINKSVIKDIDFNEKLLTRELESARKAAQKVGMIS